jgi:hypothetical protein
LDRIEGRFGEGKGRSKQGIGGYSVTDILPENCFHDWEPVVVKQQLWRRCKKCAELQPTAPPSTEDQELKQAYEYLSYWQRELRLDHIDFEIFVIAPEENKNNLADCKVAPGRHQQKIGIRHPIDRKERDKFYFRRELEVTIVHELLHTKEFTWRDHPSIDAAFEKDKWLVELHEDSLDAVAEAMVRARRGIKR